VPLSGGAVSPVRVARPVGACGNRAEYALGGVSESPDGTVDPVQSEWRCSSRQLRRSSCRARACSFGVASPAPGVGRVAGPRESPCSAWSAGPGSGGPGSAEDLQRWIESDTVSPWVHAYVARPDSAGRLTGPRESPCSAWSAGPAVAGRGRLGIFGGGLNRVLLPFGTVPVWRGPVVPGSMSACSGPVGLLGSGVSLSP
jgi:hypothetical protein